MCNPEIYLGHHQKEKNTVPCTVKSQKTVSFRVRDLKKFELEASA